MWPPRITNDFAIEGCRKGGSIWTFRPVIHRLSSGGAKLGQVFIAYLRNTINIANHDVYTVYSDILRRLADFSGTYRLRGAGDVVQFGLLVLENLLS